MNRYRNAIVFFGGVLPFIAIAGLVVGLVMGRSKLAAKRDKKESLFESYQQAAGEVANVEEELKIEGRAEQMAYWDEQLKKEFVQSLTQNLNEIASQFNEDQLTRTEFSRPGTRSPLAGPTKNQYSRFKVTFEGGFGPMQTLLADLEVRMPQLVLENIEISPVVDSNPKAKSRLKFDATYLAWHEPEEPAAK
jgi:hypothetical protein